LNGLTDNKKYYKEQIEKTKKEIELIKTSPKWVEKIAREKYLMKREGEDIFVVKEE
jgi:cell division protein FtsB